MKKIFVTLLLCSFLTLTACGTAECRGCGAKVKKNSNTENPVGDGYLCEKCLAPIQESLDSLEEITDNLQVEDQ